MTPKRGRGRQSSDKDNDDFSSEGEDELEDSADDVYSESESDFEDTGRKRNGKGKAAQAETGLYKRHRAVSYLRHYLSWQLKTVLREMPTGTC